MGEKRKFLFGKNKKEKTAEKAKVAQDNEFFKEIVEKTEKKSSEDTFDFTGNIDISTGEYTDLFDGNFNFETEETENYKRIQAERRRRVEAAAQTAGVNLESVESEFGVVAPIPVTGENLSSTMDLDNDAFQKALEKTAQNNTVEIKLNIEKEKLEFTRNVDIEKIAQKNEEVTQEVNQDQENEQVWIYKDKVLPVHVINMQVLNQEVQQIAHDVQDKDIKKAASKVKIREVKREKIVDIKEKSNDFTNPMQAKSLAISMKKALDFNKRKVAICGIASIFAIITTLANESVFTYANYEGDPTFYICAMLVQLLVVVGVCFSSFKNGIINLISGKGSVNTAVAVASVAVIIQCIMALFNKLYVTTGVAHLYGAVVTIAWLINCIGESHALRKDYNNFRFITSKEQKYAVNIYSDNIIAQNITKECAVKTPVLAYQNKTAFLKRFLELSKEKTNTEKNLNSLTQIYLIVALVICFILVLVEKNAFIGVSVFAGAMYVTMPIANIFTKEFLLNKISVQLRRAGAMATSFISLEKASSINSIMIDSSEIFFGGNVSILSYNLYNQSTNKDLEYGISLMRSVGGIYEDIAVQMDKEYNEEPLDVINCITEYGLGVSGTVAGKKVLVGTIDFMKNSNVFVPINSVYENEQTSSNKNLYIALDGKLIVVINLVYRVDRRKKLEISQMEQNGISLIVYTKDPNVTKDMLVELCGISAKSISVINEELSPIYENLVANQEERSDATVATKGRIESILNLLNVSKSYTKVLESIVFIEAIGIFMGALLIFIIAFAGGISQLSSMAVLVFLCFWAIMAFIVPKIKRK